MIQLLPIIDIHAGDRDKDGAIDVMDDTRYQMNLMIEKKIGSSTDITFKQDLNGEHNQQSWSQQLPDFLIWAFGK